MSHRRSTYKPKDRKIFRNTASKIKEINLMPKIMRGGIRL